MYFRQVNTTTSFEDSVGDCVPLPFTAKVRLGGCWRPRGSVSETFEEIYKAILSIAQAHLESPEDIILNCYMLGHSARTAVPYVSFASRDRKYRRALRRLTQSEVLHKYPGWKSVDWSEDPGSRGMIHCGNDDQEAAASVPTLRIASSTSGFGGSRIFLLCKNETTMVWKHIATGGGVLTNERGSYFLMTTAHSFPDYDGPSLPQPQEQDFEFDIDDLSESDVSDESRVDTTSDASRTPLETRRSFSVDRSSYRSPSEDTACGDTSLSEHTTETIDIALSIADLQPPQLLLTRSVSDQRPRALPVLEPPPGIDTLEYEIPSIRSSGGPRPGLDYALIEMHQIKLGGRQSCLESKPPTTVKRPMSREVIATTSSSGETRGRLLETPLLVIRPGAMQVREIWTVILEEETKEGDSGSWVFDAETGDVIGHIISTSTETGFTHIIPLFQVLDDLHQRFDGLWWPVTDADDMSVRPCAPAEQQGITQHDLPGTPTSATSKPVSPQSEEPALGFSSATTKETSGITSDHKTQVQVSKNNLRHVQDMELRGKGTTNDRVFRRSIRSPKEGCEEGFKIRGGRKFSLRHEENDSKPLHASSVRGEKSPKHMFPINQVPKDQPRISPRHFSRSSPSCPSPRLHATHDDNFSRSKGQTLSTSSISRATDADARKHRIPSGYSLKDWDPNEEPILLLGSVFDANSMGKWIYDWTTYHQGPYTPLSEMAGELWLLLIQLASKVKRSEEIVGRVREVGNRDLVEEFIEAGERLTEKFRSLLKRCESPMLKATRHKQSGLDENAGIEFVQTLFGRDKELDNTERFMQHVRLFNLRFDANCEEILRNPSK